ncbi:hypothetical protein EOM39_04070 [Candidatus Gracilibacteria bacterium]|nr:hypothetical protein [Candidatus Gracilibacteria bacterium]
MSYKNIWYEWDIIPYIGIVLNVDNSNLNYVHKNTYDLIKEGVSSERYNILVNANEYRQKVHSDKEVFNNQFPFFSIKFLYTSTIYLFNKFIGFSIINSFKILSILSYILISTIVLLLYKDKIKKDPYIMILLIPVVLSSFLILGSRITTPDMFSTLLLFFSYYLIINKKYIFIGLFVIVISLGIRTDNIIYLSVLLVYLRFFVEKDYKIDNKIFIGTLILGLLTYKLINSVYLNYGYIKLFHHSFLGQIYDPENTSVVFSFSDYFKTVASMIGGILGFKGNSTFSLLSTYLTITLYLLYSGIRYGKGIKKFKIGFIGVITIALFLKLLLFPNIQERYFIFFYLIILLSLIDKFIERQE